VSDTDGFLFADLPGPPEEQGYTTDTIFPSGFIRQQQPALLCYVAARGGFLPPDPAGPFRYLELGCAAGVTLNGLAAANPACEFVGIDLNPDHIDEARREASRARLRNVQYILSSFDRIEPPTLGRFDFIASNGTYSWLSPRALSGVHDILRRCLKSGGLFFVDYLSMPSAAMTAPLWHVMRCLTDGHPGDSQSRAERGIEVLSLLRNERAKFFSANPLATSALNNNLKRLAEKRDRALPHIAHHALAENPRAYYMPQIAEMLGELDLRFVGSCDHAVNDEDMAFPPALRDLAADINDPLTTELIKDVYRMPIQRQDVFVRDGERRPDESRDFLCYGLRFLLREPAASIRHKWSARFGEGEGFPGPAMNLVLDRLGEGCCQLAAIVPAGQHSAISIDRLASALHKVLATSTTLIASADPFAPAEAPVRALSVPSAYNAMMLERPWSPKTSRVLASPVLGSCIGLPTLQFEILSHLLRDGNLSASPQQVCAHVRAMDPRFLLHDGGPRLCELNERRVLGALRNLRRWLMPLLLALGVLRPQH
jgi:SAM-dependent methyltransferase